MSRFGLPGAVVAVALALTAIPAAAGDGIFEGGSVHIGTSKTPSPDFNPNWGKIGSITSSTPIGSFSLIGGTITGPSIAGLAKVDLMLIPAGQNINSSKGPFCHIPATVTPANPVINGKCNPALAAGSYDVYMNGKGNASAFGTKYNFNLNASMCSSAPSQDGSEGDADSHFKNPATTTAVLGGNGTILPGSIVTLQVQVAHCRRIVVTELSLYAVPTAPDTFMFLADETRSSVETVNFQRQARTVLRPCDSVSLPVGHGVNQPGGRFTIGVTAECFFSGPVDEPRSFAVKKSAAVWIDAGIGQGSNAAVGSVNGGYDACPTGKGR